MFYPYAILENTYDNATNTEHVLIMLIRSKREVTLNIIEANVVSITYGRMFETLSWLFAYICSEQEKNDDFKDGNIQFFVSNFEEVAISSSATGC